MNTANYFFAGYVIFWVATFVYLVSLHKRQTDLRHELDRFLRGQLDKKTDH